MTANASASDESIGTMPADVEADTREDAIEAAEAQPDFPETAEDRVRAMAQQFINDRGLLQGGMGNPGGAVVEVGIATVNMPLNADWSAARINAFDNAIINAQQSILFSTVVDSLQETVRTQYDDIAALGPDEGREPPRDRFEMIMRKVEALGEKTLDAALMKFGMTEAELADLTIEKKRVIHQNQLVNTTMQKTRGVLSGTRVVQSFEANVGNDFAAGVVVISKPSYRDVADLIVHGGQLAEPAEGGKPLAEWIGGATEEELMDTYGVRVYPDENGQPIVVAFAQAGVPDRPGSASRMTQRVRQGAYRIAEQKAVGMITQYANTTANAERSSTTGGELEDAELTDLGTGVTRDVEGVERQIAKSLEEFRSQSSAKIYGTSVVRRWRYVHPTAKKEVVGVMVAWSPASSDAAKDRQAGKQRTNKKEPEPKASQDGKRRGIDSPID